MRTDGLRDDPRWGATIEAPPQSNDMREWTVKLRSGSLGRLAVDDTLARFVADAKRLAPETGLVCSLNGDQLSMTLTVFARGADQAATSGTHVFKTALATALEPHFAPSMVARSRAVVMPVAA